MKILTLDVGGTAIKTALMNDGVMENPHEMPSEAKQGGPVVLQNIQKIIDACGDFDAIGISTAGQVDSEQGSIIYANEADVLNVAMFGMTAKQWREANPELKGNIRDYATINELICLSNMENLNAVFIEQNMTQRERLVKLNQIAIHQMSILESGDSQNCKLLK